MSARGDILYPVQTLEEQAAADAAKIDAAARLIRKASTLLNGVQGHRARMRLASMGGVSWLGEPMVAAMLDLADQLDAPGKSA